MAAIDEIIRWANKSLPKWQGDAVRRLLIAGEQPLSVDEYSELLALAKSELKISSKPPELNFVLPATGQFSGVPAAAQTIALISIRDVQNVNIIKPGQELGFAESGITVVYGDNGAGKSGYARILKSACQARDKDERVLPDVRSRVSGVPSATIKIRNNGIERDILWKQHQDSDPILTNIAVFDSRCARIIVDERNEISYLPYGCDVFEKLAELIRRIRSDIDSEVIDLESVHTALTRDSAILDNSPSKKLLLSLSESTEMEDVDNATLWTSEDEKSLENASELLRDSGIDRLSKESARLEKVKTRLDNAVDIVQKLLITSSALTNEIIQAVLMELQASREAYKIAVNEKQTPEPLSGVASTNQWQLLYDAAKRYSEEVAYPQIQFPNIKDARCVLCQQPLTGEGIARFERFKKYVEDVTSSIVEAKLSGLNSLRQKFEAIMPLSGDPLDSICDEISTLDTLTSGLFRNFHTTLLNRKNEAIELLTKQDISLTVTPTSVSESPETALQLLSESISKKIQEIKAAANPEEHKQLEDKVRNLMSRKSLSSRRSDIVDYLSKARRNAEIKKASKLLKTNDVTIKGREIISNHLTPDFIEAFEGELRALNAERLPISIRPKSEKGETAHQMVLKNVISEKISVSEVLSEGEAKVVGIAGFLAELRLVQNPNPIVLDDPVSSLDHKFTLRIAERLIRAGVNRQVIIFTHNIALLMELEYAKEQLSYEGIPVNFIVQTLRQFEGKAGVLTQGNWHSMKTNQRAHSLDQRLNQFKSLYNSDTQSYNEQAAELYGFLREAWESCIEDDLLDRIICRYRKSVQVGILDKLVIEDKDVDTVNLNYANACNWMTGHDKSKALDTDRPKPEDIFQDIQALRDFSKMINKRLQDTKKRREAQRIAPPAMAIASDQSPSLSPS